MVILAVGNCPMKKHMKDIIKELAPVVGVHFESLVFRNAKFTKTLYIKVPDKHPIEEVIKRINKKQIKGTFLNAYIPDVIPDIVTTAKPKSIPTKLRRKLQITPNLTVKQLVDKALENILREMQMKYTGLHNLSVKFGHHLLDNIAREVFDRLSIIVDRNEDIDSCFKLTSKYRLKHAHNTDFQFIQSVLHNVQTALAMPLTTLHERPLLKLGLKRFLQPKMTREDLAQVCDENIKRISEKLVEHVTKLDVTTEPSTPLEEARVKVRKQLKNMDMYLPELVKTVIYQHFFPPEDTYRVVKIYGEPFLPGKDFLTPFTEQFLVTNAIRSELMYNLLSVKVHRSSYEALLKKDGYQLQTHARPVKLVIRPANLPIYLYKPKQFNEAPGMAEPPQSLPLGQDEVAQSPGEDEATQLPGDELAQPPSLEKNELTQPPPSGEDEFTQPLPSGEDDLTQLPPPEEDDLTQPPFPGKDDLTQPAPPGVDDLTQPPPPGEDEVSQPPAPGEDELTQPPPPGTEDEHDHQGQDLEKEGQQVHQDLEQEGQGSQVENMDWSDTW